MNVVTNLGANLLKFADINGVRGLFFVVGLTGNRHFDRHRLGVGTMKMGDDFF